MNPFKPQPTPYEEEQRDRELDWRDKTWQEKANNLNQYKSNPMNKIHLQGEWKTHTVILNGNRLDPAISQKIWNHSPDGFNWGYGGSGPAQLALAICFALWGNPGEEDTLVTNAVKAHQPFKWKFLTALPQNEDFDVILDLTKFIEEEKLPILYE